MLKLYDFIENKIKRSYKLKKIRYYFYSKIKENNYSIFPCVANKTSSYKDILSLKSFSKIDHPSSPVIITGRFRSGSTLLWNIFRQIDGVTSYYEPLNERKWFDHYTRGEKVDTTHVNVRDDYWREYDGLYNQLKHLYQERWVERNLYMDKNSSDWDLHRYIAELAKGASGIPVLQFNRVDFRLPWLKRIFSQSIFIHIFRHPRDQWISTLMDPKIFGSNSGNLTDFAKADKFYLRMWVSDLQHWFPFLKDSSRHPYYHFYFLWKLSFLFGKEYCQYSLKFEDLVDQPSMVLKPLFADLEIHNPNWNKILPIIVRPEIGKWRLYAPESWFLDIEAECEEEMQMFFGWGSDGA